MNPYFFAVRECEIGECVIGDSPLLHLKKKQLSQKLSGDKRGQSPIAH